MIPATADPAVETPPDEAPATELGVLEAEFYSINVPKLFM